MISCIILHGKLSYFLTTSAAKACDCSGHHEVQLDVNTRALHLATEKKKVN